MTLKRNLLIIFVVLLVLSAVCRVAGFAPQLAIAIFAGAIIRDKKLAFALPLVSMLLSDVLYEVLFQLGYVNYGGFYEGQLLNYFLIASVTVFGFLIRRWNVLQIAAATIAAPAAYFILSNFAVWIGGGGWFHPKTFDGLMSTYRDGLPFLRSSLESTIIFSAVLFVGYYLLQRFVLEHRYLAGVKL